MHGGFRITHLVLALAALAAVAPADASPAHYEPSWLVGVARNGLPLATGDLIDWTVVVVNAGYIVGAGVVVTDTLDPAHDFVAASDGGIYDSNTRTVRWDSATTPALAAGISGWGGQVTLRLTTRVAASPAPPSIANQAFVTDMLDGPFGTYDPRVTPGGARPSAVPADAPLLDARLGGEETSGDGIYSAGERVRYTLTQTNLGNTRFDAAGAAAALPAELESLAIVSLPTGAVDLSDLGQHRFEVGGISLPVGGTARVVFEGTVQATTGGGSHLCTRAAIRGGWSLGQQSEDASPVGGETCFTTHAIGWIALSSVRPCRGWTLGDTTVRIEGTGFASGVAVTIGGETANVVSVTPTRIVLTTPPVPATTTGSADVVVLNPDRTSSTLPSGWTWTEAWPLGVQTLRSAKSAGRVSFQWNGAINFMMARASGEHFECDETTLRLVPQLDFSVPDLNDGKTWFYRAE